MSDVKEINELNVLTRTEEQITIGGRTLTVNRIRLRQLPKVMALVQPVLGFVMKREGEAPANKIDVATMLMTHGPEVVSLVAEIMTLKDQVVEADWIQDLELDEVIDLTGKVLEVNLDFFIQKVIPSLSTVLGSLNAEIQFNLPAGMIPSQP